VKRRQFLRDSAIGVGTLMTGVSFGEVNASTQQNPAEVGTNSATSSRLVEVPGTSLEIVDGWTKIPVTVTLGKFLMSPTAVTQREYAEISGDDPSFYRGADLPVENVSWWEAVRYCNLRSLKEKLDPCYDLESGFCDMRKNGYRLPSDTEWTHASDGAPKLPLGPNDANVGDSDTTHVGRLLEELHVGTKPVGSFPANRYGLYDMIGNVWEWCTDYFNPVDAPQASYNPAGPLRGLSRVVRGGSFVTVPAQAKGYRRCVEPEYKSRFTGFRVCRTLDPDPVLPAVHRSLDWFAVYNQAPPGYERTTGGLSSLVEGISSVAEWQLRRAALQKKWLKILGSMDIEPPPPMTRLVRVVEDQNYTAKLMHLQVENHWWEKILVMMPTEAMTSPRPVVIVPYYDVDSSAAKNLSGNFFLGETVDPYAYCAVQKGYIAVAIRWWGESYGESYSSEAVANLKLRHPQVTGLGKWVWDARRLVDYLYTLPEVDRRHIGIIGHSLGGKMALYAPAFDERITAVVPNELGIGLSFSNYDDYWYLGDFIRNLDRGTDHHELMALIAPRPFLLVGGDKYDTKESWYYINAVRPVYQLYGKPRNIGYFNHHTGHFATPESVWLSNEWLAHFLGAPGQMSLDPDS
jgi:formylglycine-generating enzyme required for sulfatase activity